jgi:ketopantoate hydroxymethyltransferase
MHPQVLVIHDLLGLTEKPSKLAKAYANIRETTTEAVEAFVRDWSVPVPGSICYESRGSG